VIQPPVCAPPVQNCCPPIRGDCCYTRF
jgi:hypothetical protein